MTLNEVAYPPELLSNEERDVIQEVFDNLGDAVILDTGYYDIIRNLLETSIDRTDYENIYQEMVEQVRRYQAE
jgi:hypothetical protein